MEVIIFFALVVVIILLLIYSNKNHKRSTSSKPMVFEQALEKAETEAETEREDKEFIPYKIRDEFLSESENMFFLVLKNALPRDIIICPKVGLSDLFFCSASDKRIKNKGFNRIRSKNVDFVLCKNDKKLSPICAIELDDLSHSWETRQKRDVFVNELFKIAKLPLVRLESKNSYSIDEINDAIATVPEIIDSKVIKLVKEDDKVCPICNVPMVKKTIKKGNNKGQVFYGCQNYPSCKEVVNL